MEQEETTEPNPYKSPIHGESSFVEPTEAVLASRWTRFFANLLDGLLAAAIYVPIFLSTDYFERLNQAQLTLGEHIGLVLVGAISWLVLNVYLLATRGQTLAKVITRIQIVDVESNKLLPFFRVYVIRYLWLFPFVLFSIFVPFPGELFFRLFASVDALMIFTKEKRCLHDRLAGSKVVVYVPTRSHTWGGISHRPIEYTADDIAVHRKFKQRQLEKRVALLERLANSDEKDTSIKEIIETNGSTPLEYLNKTYRLAAQFLAAASMESDKKTARELLKKLGEIEESANL